MEIVQYTESMNKTVYKFMEKAFKENGRTFRPRTKEKDISCISQEYLVDGNFWCLLNTKGDICGTIALRKLEDYYEIRRFFILKKYQNIGYGKKLLDTVINFAIDMEFRLLKAATMKNGLVAQHLFLKCGFTWTEQYNNSSADIFYQFELTRENIFNYKIGYLKNKFETSLILNPTENVPYYYDLHKTDFFSGLYVSERFKDVNDKVIFAGRNDYISFFAYIKKEWKQELNAFDIDLKTLSGLNAHLIFFLCILQPGDKVMVLPEICGGHFATEQILKNIGATTYQMVPDFTHLSVDSKKTIEIIEKEKINYVFVDRSEGLYYEDFSWLKKCNCYKIFDASQYISSILCKRFPNPFDMGFDMIITTLHKNYPGPQKGLLAVKSQNDKVWEQYLLHAKTYISNTHPKSIADSLIPLLNKSNFKEYCLLCEKCTQLLENKLYEENVPVIRRNQYFLPTHHIWILCSNKYDSYKYYLKLEALGLLTNYRLLPYNLGYGLRIGVNGSVLCGLKEEHIPTLAAIMGDAYFNNITHKLKKRGNTFIKNIKATAL